MAEESHPIRLAALAVAGTIGLASVVVSQWILPTQTAALTHEITLLKERLEKAADEKASLQQAREKLAQSADEQKAHSKSQFDALSAENKTLKEKLFSSEKANAFRTGDAYPVGYDKVKIGDGKDKVSEAYRGADIKETGRTITVSGVSDLFLAIRFTHSSHAKTAGKIDSIRFDLGATSRVFNKSLPRVPANWLQDSLQRALGEPMLIGFDNRCRFWKSTDNDPVYYLTGDDDYEISGYVTYPPGCHITDEQKNRLQKRR